MNRLVARHLVQTDQVPDVAVLVVSTQGGGDDPHSAQEGKHAQTSLRVDQDTWLRSDGFMIHPSRSEQAVEKQATKRVAERHPGVPEVSETGQKQFRDTVRLLEEHGTSVIATEIPYSPAYQDALEKKYPGYDEQRQDAATALTDQDGVRHVPVDAFGDWWGDGDSRDEIHLSSQGAGEFTHQLLEDTPGFRAAVTDGLEE